MQYLTNTSELTAVADAIREKGGTSAPLTYPFGYVSAIQDIQTGGDIDALIDRAISGTYENSTVTHIGNGAFMYCGFLCAVYFPNCEIIAQSAFNLCSGLSIADFPVCTSIHSSAFAICRSLATISFPACETIGTAAFNSCSALISVDFPTCTDILSSAFYYCSGMETASFPVCQNMNANAFAQCRLLTSLYLMGSLVVSLKNSNAFSSTPIGGYSASAGQYGSIYVPASLLTDYQTATNWTYYSSRFVGV
jgi:hypothetical protein